MCYSIEWDDDFDYTEKFWDSDFSWDSKEESENIYATYIISGNSISLKSGKPDDKDN